MQNLLELLIEQWVEKNLLTITKKIEREYYSTEKFLRVFADLTYEVTTYEVSDNDVVYFVVPIEHSSLYSITGALYQGSREKILIEWTREITKPLLCSDFQSNTAINFTLALINEFVDDAIAKLDNEIDKITDWNDMHFYINQKLETTLDKNTKKNFGTIFDVPIYSANNMFKLQYYMYDHIRETIITDWIKKTLVE